MDNQSTCVYVRRGCLDDELVESLAWNNSLSNWNLTQVLYHGLSPLLLLLAQVT